MPNLLLGVVFTTFVCSISFAPVMAADEPPTEKEVKRIRALLNGDEFDERKTLIGLGEAPFPAYEVIIKDAKSDPIHVIRAFGMIQKANADRSKFLPYAIDRMADPMREMRCTAAQFVGAVGSEKDTPLLLVLLSDKEMTVANRAATALTKIGTDKDLMAIKLWLAVNDHNLFQPERQASHEALLKHVAKCRDELKARLEKEKPKK